jgi:hypothetical protein
MHGNETNNGTTTIQQPVARMAMPSILDNAHNFGTNNTAVRSETPVTSNLSSALLQEVQAANLAIQNNQQNNVACATTTAMIATTTAATTATATTNNNNNNNNNTANTTTTTTTASSSLPLTNSVTTLNDVPLSDSASKLRMAVNAPEFIPGNLAINTNLANTTAAVSTSTTTINTINTQNNNVNETLTDNKSTSLWVGGLYDLEYTEADIRHFFESVGGIESVNLVLDANGRVRQFCFVNFIDQDTRDRASMLTGQYLHGKQVTLRIANRRVAERIIKGTGPNPVPMTPASSQMYFNIKAEERGIAQRNVDSIEESMTYSANNNIEESLDQFPHLSQVAETLILPTSMPASVADGVS